MSLSSCILCFMLPYIFVSVVVIWIFTICTYFGLFRWKFSNNRSNYIYTKFTNFTNQQILWSSYIRHYNIALNCNLHWNALNYTLWYFPPIIFTFTYRSGAKIKWNLESRICNELVLDKVIRVTSKDVVENKCKTCY